MSADLDRSRPVWRQVAEAISRRIADGTYPPGSQVPGIVGLSAEFGIAASTAQEALAHLRDTGEVRTELGLGHLRRRLEVGRLNYGGGVWP